MLPYYFILYDLGTSHLNSFLLECLLCFYLQFSVSHEKRPPCKSLLRPIKCETREVICNHLNPVFVLLSLSVNKLQTRNRMLMVPNIHSPAWTTLKLMGNPGNTRVSSAGLVVSLNTASSSQTMTLFLCDHFQWLQSIEN